MQVRALDEEFHFVLIAEHFDESLGGYRTK